MNKFYLGIAGVMSVGLSMAQAPLAKKNLQFSEVKGTTQIPASTKSQIWSDDFSNASNWTMVDNAGSGDNWVIGTTPPSGSFAIDTIASTTAANGFALFDSDLLCSGNQNADVHSVTPVDLTSYPYVSLKFQSFYRRYQGNAYVIASPDGVNWTQIEVHTDLNVNSSCPNPTVVQVNLSAIIGGSATAYVGFRYVGGCDYAWMVDDVELVTTDQYDLAYTGTYWGTTGNWGARLPYYQLPLAQAQPINFSGIAVNNGYATQSDVVFTAAIPTSGYTSSSSVATLAQNQLDTIDAPTAFTPTAMGTYTVSGGVSSSATDATPADNLNASAVVFNVNDRYYARDKGTVEGGSYNQGQAFDVGNMFDMFADATLYSVRVQLGATSEVGHILRIRIYDANLNILSQSEHEVLAGEPGTMISIALDSPYDLLADSSYCITAGGYGDNGATDDIVIGTSGNSEAQTTFYLDETDTWFYTTSTPMIQLDFANPNGLAENSADLGVSVYPNPANDAAKVSFTLPSAAEATVSVVDVTGKVVYSNALGNVAAGKQVVDLNTANFAAGSYTVKIVAGDAVNTKKLIVRK